MMKGIYFDNIHSYDDMNLILSSVSIPPPAVKTNYVNIPGADGQIDLTEALGEVYYKDRECSFTFSTFPYENIEEKKTQITNLLHGKRCKITLDKDPDYYWEGRCKVNSYASDRNLHQIVVGATVSPYKLKQLETIRAVHFCGKNLCRASVDRTSTYRGITSTRSANSSEMILDGVGEIDFSMIMADELYLNPGTYTVSVYGLNDIDTNHDRCYLYDLDNAKAIVNYIKPGKPGTFTVTDTVRIRTDVVISEGSTYNNQTIQIQIEAGDVATEYEAYTASTDPVDLTLTNNRKSVVPTITCTGDTTITVDDSVYELSAGTHKVLDIRLLEGETPMTLVGSGSTLFVYREGDL